MRVHILGALALLCFISVALAQPPQWAEGSNYFSIEPVQITNLPSGKIEVTEVFSYACPACSRFNPYMDRLRKDLPASVVIDYVAAGFIPAEDWPVFQRAYYTAKSLGIAASTHNAMFDAVWKTGSLRTVDRGKGTLKSRLPNIQDVAEWYHEQTGIGTQRFIDAAYSPGVDLQIRRANSYILACQVTATPTIIVNGRYRADPSSAGDYSKMVTLVEWLVATRTPR